jgi:hypothetical protein
MPTDTPERAADRRDAALVGSTGAPDGGARCFRCDEHPGQGYVAEVGLPPGRRRERATAILDALVGGVGCQLCPGCAGILAVYGYVLGWQLRTAGTSPAVADLSSPR